MNSLKIPDKNLQDIIHGKETVSGKRESELIGLALANPISSSTLKKLLGVKLASILASDITRSCPPYKFLPSLIDELKESGIEEITILPYGRFAMVKNKKSNRGAI